MRDIAIGENRYVNPVFEDQVLQIFLFENRNALRVQTPGKFRRIPAPGDVGNLRGGESHYLVFGIIAKQDVEVVEVPACGS
jgi:hypothetical protein